jgi:hypothetical protein
MFDEATIIAHRYRLARNFAMPEACEEIEGFRSTIAANLADPRVLVGRTFSARAEVFGLYGNRVLFAGSAKFARHGSSQWMTRS